MYNVKTFRCMNLILKYVLYSQLFVFYVIPWYGFLTSDIRNDIRNQLKDYHEQEQDVPQKTVLFHF